MFALFQLDPNTTIEFGDHKFKLIFKIRFLKKVILIQRRLLERIALAYSSLIAKRNTEKSQEFLIE